MSKNRHIRRKKKNKASKKKYSSGIGKLSKNHQDFFRNDIKIEDDAYGKIRDGKHPKEVFARNLCNVLWRKFEPYSDRHFIEQSAIDFYARFWEMNLTVSLIEQGFSIECPKPGPDVCLKLDNLNIWIEAIAPKEGLGVDKVPKVEFDVVQSIPDDKIILRYTSAISEKYKKYQEYLKKGTVSENEPYVIALNGCQVPDSTVEYSLPRILRSVFPIGNMYISIDPKTGKKVNGGFKNRFSVKKENGSNVNTNHFTDQNFSGVSAVLFSCSDCFNRVHSVNDWIIVHNPMAKNPLPIKYISCSQEYAAELRKEYIFIRKIRKQL